LNANLCNTGGVEENCIYSDFGVENTGIWFERDLPECFPFHCFAMTGIRAFAENHHLCSSKGMSV